VDTLLGVAVRTLSGGIDGDAIFGLILPDFLLRWIGKDIADKLNLQEDSKMDGTKPWYQSKTIWSGVVAALISIYNTVGAVKGLPVVPDWVYTILAAIGVYSRTTATTTIQ
jgi:hypothetical protein